MVATKEISLEMKDAVDRIRREAGHVCASHSFASLYSWKEDMGLSIYLEQEMYAVRCLWRGVNTWFFPCGNTERIRELVGLLLEEPGLVFCYLRESDAAFLERAFPGQFLVEEKAADHEYLYDPAAQRELKGRVFAKNRQQIHRLRAEHELKMEPLKSDNLAEALEIGHAWYRESDGEGCLEDKSAFDMLLHNWKALEVQGILVAVDGVWTSVLVGYPLTHDMFDFAFIKQKNRLAGLSVFTKHMMFLHMPESCALVNAEEDLGIEGLRFMKQRMQPVGQIKMYEGRSISLGRTK